MSHQELLARVQQGLRVGQRVTQKQVLGYVGQTGLATGPHVCFRVSHEGRYVHPAKVESPASSPIPDEKWIDFQLVRDLRLAHLEAGTLVSTEEAL